MSLQEPQLENPITGLGYYKSLSPKKPMISIVTLTTNSNPR